MNSLLLYKDHANCNHYMCAFHRILLFLYLIGPKIFVLPFIVTTISFYSHDYQIRKWRSFLSSIWVVRFKIYRMFTSSSESSHVWVFTNCICTFSYFCDKIFGKIYYGQFLWVDGDKYTQAGKTGMGRGPWAVAHTPVRKQEQIGGRVRL